MADNNDFCQSVDDGGQDIPKWSLTQEIISLVTPKHWTWLGKYSKEEQIFRYKRAWIAYNRGRIIAIAKDNNIPPDLLGCVAFNEAGGDPPSFKHYSVLTARQYVPYTADPMKTSEGAIKIQLVVALKAMGYDGNQNLTHDEQNQLTRCLEQDVFNLSVVAKHLRQLILFDYPGTNTLNLTDEQFVMAGCRYNRGTSRALGDLLRSYHEPEGSKSPDRDYSSYGRRCLQHRAEVRSLLGL